MKGVLLKFFVINFVVFLSVWGLYCDVVIVNSGKGKMEEVALQRSYYETQFDVVSDEAHPFAFTVSPLGHALRFLSRVLGELHVAQDNKVMELEFLNSLENFCDKILDLSTFCDVACAYVKRQIALTPEKQCYFLDEMQHLRQRVYFLLNMFSALVGEEELSSEIITIFVVLDRLKRKTEQSSFSVDLL